MKTRCLLISMIVMFVVSLLTAANSAAVSLDNCIGIWLFDEGEGDVAADSSGNGNNGAFNGAPEWVDGKFGGALEFGAPNYVDCGNTDSLDIETGGSITMCAWVYSNVGSTGAWQGIMAKRDANYSYGINIITGNFQVYTTGGSGIAGFAYNVPQEEWTFICGTMSGDPSELYVNGELFGTTGGGGGIFSSAANLFRIGASFANGEIFDGIIDEVALFDVVLDADDINDIMNKGLGVATGITAVDPSSKLAVTWASVKTQ